jgi:hypothetical protein
MAIGGVFEQWVKTRIFALRRLYFCRSGDRRVLPDGLLPE